MTTTRGTDGMLRGVYVASVDERSRSALEIFLATQYGESIALKPAEEADVAVFDLDGETAEGDLADYQESFPGRPAIGLSVRPDDYEALGADLRVLAKPPSFSDLRELFDELIAEADGSSDPEWGEIPVLEDLADTVVDPTADHRNGSVPEAPSASAAKVVEHLAGREPTDEVVEVDEGEDSDPVGATTAFSLGLESDSDYYDPEEYLQGPVVDAMVAARSDDVAVCLVGDWGELLIDPDDRSATLKGSMSDLRDACAHPVDPAWLTLDQPGPSTLEAFDGHLPRWTWEGLVWDITLWAAAGRLPAGADPDETVSLRQWPNLTRLTIPPHALQVAAVWSRTPMSVSRTTAMLGMDVADVRNFYATVSALGLAVTGAPESGATYPVIEPEVREILASVLDRVRVRPS